MAGPARQCSSVLAHCMAAGCGPLGARTCSSPIYVLRHCELGRATCAVVSECIVFRWVWWLTVTAGSRADALGVLCLAVPVCMVGLE